MAVDVKYVIFSLNSYNKFNANTMLGQIIESPLPNLTFPVFPGSLTFVVSIMLRGIKENDEFYLRFMIFDSQEEEIIDTEDILVPAEKNTSEDYIPIEHKSRFVSFRLNDVTFPKEGEYLYTLVIDGRPEKVDSFGVFQKPKGDTHE